MKLTKSKRLSIYKEIRKYIADNIEEWGEYGAGFCYAIEYGTNEEGINISMFPELMMYKPERFSVASNKHWFSCSPYGDRKRLRILDEIINSMSKRRRRNENI